MGLMMELPRDLVWAPCRDAIAAERSSALGPMTCGVALARLGAKYGIRSVSAKELAQYRTEYGNYYRKAAALRCSFLQLGPMFRYGLCHSLICHAVNQLPWSERQAGVV